MSDAATIAKLMAEVIGLTRQVQELHTENNRLRDRVARLEGQTITTRPWRLMATPPAPTPK